MLRRSSFLMLTLLAGCECSSKTAKENHVEAPECALVPLIQPCVAYLKRTCSIDDKFVMAAREDTRRGLVVTPTSCDGGVTLIPRAGDAEAPRHLLYAGIGHVDGGSAFVLSVVGNPATFPSAELVTVPCGTCTGELPAEWNSPGALHPK